jgi:hypothetical protein
MEIGVEEGGGLVFSNELDGFIDKNSFIILPTVDKDGGTSGCIIDSMLNFSVVPRSRSTDVEDVSYVCGWLYSGSSYATGYEK